MAVAIGCLACALLVANNLRDIPTDRVAGKRTLAVRLGDRGARALYLALVVVPYVLVLGLAWHQPWVLVTLASAALLRPRRPGRRRGGPDAISSPPCATPGEPSSPSASWSRWPSAFG